MKTGANRKTIGTGSFSLTEPTPPPLGKVGRTDFTAFPDAEREIVGAFVRHTSLLRAEQNAPNLKRLQEKLDGLTRTVQICRDQMAGFLKVGEDRHERIEFRAAISDLLLDHDLERQNMELVIEDAIDDLAKINIFLSAAKLALERRVREGEIVEVSSRRARDDYLRRLHTILTRHGLDGKTGQNSLIVHLVIRLDGKWKLTAKSGPEASEEGEMDSRIRKDLADEIRKAVKAQKSG